MMACRWSSWQRKSEPPMKHYAVATLEVTVLSWVWDCVNWVAQIAE